MGFTITKFGTYGTDYMKKTLNRLKFKDHYGKYLKYYTGQDSSEDIDLVFYYDTRDFNYYGDVNCQLQMGDEYKKDVTVRLVRNSSSQDWELWFYPGHNKSSAKPSTSGGWENVSQGTKRCWEVKGRTQCYLDWENLAPTTPQNFQLSGSVGQHPTLTWQMNREPDLNGYKIYRSENGQAYNHLYTVGINATSYTDNEVTIGNNKNDPTVCYKITAYDTDNLESSFTNSKCLKASAINKEIVGSLTETDYSYNLSYPYPNPFNPITNINFTIKKEGNVKIILYDLLGNTINILVDDYLSKGSYSLKLDASYLPSGLYFYAMNINNYFDVKKLQVIK
jgi:hypothetical protein